MINLSLNELKLIAKSRNIKDYKNKSEIDLIEILSEPKPKIILSKKKIKEIKKEFNELRYGFSKSKINEFRRSIDNIKKQKDLSAPEIKETEKNLHKLEKSIFNLKKYYDYDDTKYRRLRDIENLFNGNLLNRVAPNIIDREYYKPIKTKSAFITLNMNVKEMKTKICHLKNILILLDHI